MTQKGKWRVKYFPILTSRVVSDTESCDEVLPYEELTTSYKYLVARSTNMCRLVEKQEKTISQL